MSETCQYSLEVLNNRDTNLEASWNCPHDTYEDEPVCIFHMESEKRSSAGITTEDIVEEIHENLRSSDRTLNEYIGASLPELTFTKNGLDAAGGQELRFKHCEIDGIIFGATTVNQNFDFSGSDIGTIIMDNTTIDGRFIANNATVSGEVEIVESEIHSDFDFVSTTFSEKVNIEETDVFDESSFDEAVFKDDVSFQLSELWGKSNDLNDNASFSGCNFHGKANFSRAVFGHSTFENAEFRNEFNMHDATISGGMIMKNIDVREESFMTSMLIKDNIDLSESLFTSKVNFEDSVVDGGTNMIIELNFKNTEFERNAIFHEMVMNRAIFDNAVFRQKTSFEEVDFMSDVSFIETKFEGLADFDETRFNEDVSFRRAIFSENAMFRGTEFRGDANHIEENALFDKARFEREADFSDSSFSRASFNNTYFGDVIDFMNCEFQDRIVFGVYSINTDTYVNLTGSVLSNGEIIQKSGDAIPYDLTNAEVGDMTLRGDVAGHELLDYFRFCRTKFNGFEFSNHHDFFERNNWNIHSFKEPESSKIDYAVPMTPESIEMTYLYAQNNATQTGNKRAASEFEIKRHRYNRQKNKQLMFDTTEPIDTLTRIKKGVSVMQDYFMDKTCGYGSRLPRIFALTVFLPIFYGVLYVQGGPLKTGAGNIWNTAQPLAVLFDGIYYSYISFSTIGYGGIGPIGWLAKILAASQGMLNGIFFALLIYTLSKRIDY